MPDKNYIQADTKLLVPMQLIVHIYANILQSEEGMIYNIVTVLHTIQVVLFSETSIVTGLFIWTACINRIVYTLSEISRSTSFSFY